MCYWLIVDSFHSYTLSGKKQDVGILHFPLHIPLDTLIFTDLCAATAACFYVCQACVVKYLDATKLTSNNINIFGYISAHFSVRCWFILERDQQCLCKQATSALERQMRLIICRTRRHAMFKLQAHTDLWVAPVE